MFQAMYGQRFLLLFSMLILTSCSDRWDAWKIGAPERREEVATLFSLLDETQGKTDQKTFRNRFAINYKIASILVSEKRYARLASFMSIMPARLAASRERGFIPADSPAPAPSAKDPYEAWYLYTAAAAYEHEGALPVAALYYDRIVKTCPDLIVDGKSIHFLCLSRLIDTTASPERRIAYYTDLIRRFPDATDMGRSLFLLGKEYEKTGEWNKAVETYRDFLPWFGTTVPGYPDAFLYARNLVELASSPRDWTYPDLNSLIAEIRRALAAGSARQLRKLSSKVGFFAVSWHQGDEQEANSQVVFDFAEFMKRGKISVAVSLDPSSGERDAYLKTTGWNGSLPTWYFYFRKVDFPADPDTHGNWEWAGIYFGDKMQ
jgi:tetratricopeptide (TPR) repeat protein